MIPPRAVLKCDGCIIQDNGSARHNTSEIPSAWRTIKDMARGWESKSVEEQQSAAEPTASGASVVGARQNALERAKVERQRQELELQRERILSERTSSPVRRAALESALSDIESRLALLS